MAAEDTYERRPLRAAVVVRFGCMTDGTLLLEKCLARGRIRGKHFAWSMPSREYQQRYMNSNPFSIHEMLTGGRRTMRNISALATLRGTD